MITKETKAPPAEGLQQSFEAAFDLCLAKTRRNIKCLADEPKSGAWAKDGDYFNFPEGFYEIGNWTSSFFTGMALLGWRQTDDERLIQNTLRLAPHYRAKVFIHYLDTHHDLGFLYSLYSVALYKLTGQPEHREVALRAAHLLAERFHPAGKFIRAWGRMDTTEHDNMAIIDCLMNLPLLHWAAIETGDESFRSIAVKHADMALRYFVRADDSVYHAYRFDLKTGTPIGGDTFGGWAVESHWARGTAWAIYGFALSYKYTKEPRYLDASFRIAKKFVAGLDEEIVPLWDFKLPPKGQRFIRDASAGAVAVCGLQELIKYDVRAKSLADSARLLLTRLCSRDYLDSDESRPGILKHCQVGDGKGGALAAYTSWGDYYLMEALVNELDLGETFW